MFTKINTKMTEARDEEGFTLIELLVVILIIGILAAIAIPVFLNQQKAAVKGGIKSDVRNTATNIATSLVTSPSATGFTPYAAGTTAPAVTGGAVAVQTVNSADDVITITKNPATGAAPSTGTGAGQWNDYQIVGTSARVPNYCFVFSSTSGKYTEYNDCTVATGSSTGGSTTAPTTPATTAPEVLAAYKSYNFDTGSQGWMNTYTSTSINSGTGANARSGSSLYFYGNSAVNQEGVSVFPSAVVGQKYRITAYVKQVNAGTISMFYNSSSTTSTTTVGAFTLITVDYTPTTTNPRIEITSKGTSSSPATFVDDVTIQTVN